MSRQSPEEKAAIAAHNASCVAVPVTSRRKPRANDEDVPLEEMVLAKMLQSARARGLRPIRHALYEYRGDGSTELRGCCAIGAFHLDTLGEPIHFRHISRGNDEVDYTFINLDEVGFALGAAFQSAMRDEEDQA